MADKPNGAGAPYPYLPSPAGHHLPPAPGAAVSSLPPVGASIGQGAPIEYETSVPETFVPETSEYVGGGIFDSVPGPAATQAEERGEPPSSSGFDFAPTAMALPPVVGDGMFVPGAAVGHIEQEHAHMLGLSVIAVAVGAVVGTKYGGMYGGIAGSLFAGAGINAYRALTHLKEGTPESDKEAKVSGTYAVGAAAIGAALWAKLATGPYGANWSRSGSDDSTSNPACGIRRVGP